MAVISVKTKNFKKLVNVDLKFNGKTFFVIGDIKEGKTTLLNLILCTLMLQEFPEDPLTQGTDSGFIETVHEWDGIKYTIKRTFSNNKDSKTRFTVIDENGGRHTLSTLLEKLFGKAFTNSYFDYNQFFFECKSSEARTTYIIKAAGGDEVFENLTRIKVLKKERGSLGTEVDKYTYIIENSSLNPETLAEDIVLYAEEKNFDEALKKKAEILLTRKSIINLTTQLTIVKEGNSAFDISQEALVNVDNEIEELKKKLADAKNRRIDILNWQVENQPDVARELELEKEIATAEDFNRDIERQADEIYEEMVLAINSHNRMRIELNNTLVSYNELLRCSNEWEVKDAEIKELTVKNKEIFKNRLPIPDMTIDELDDKPIVMYNGREFCYENLSKGESLRLAMEIQRYLNPKGNNLIVIPEAQSLGSELDDILKECKDHNIQAVVEITERKQKFQIKFEEDFV